LCAHLVALKRIPRPVCLPCSGGTDSMRALRRLQRAQVKPGTPSATRFGRSRTMTTAPWRRVFWCVETQSRRARSGRWSGGAQVGSFLGRFRRPMRLQSEPGGLQAGRVGGGDKEAERA
ncbi:unnamed protein product, partial [Amoebophrya sp. A120]